MLNLTSLKIMFVGKDEERIQDSINEWKGYGKNYVSVLKKIQSMSMYTFYISTFKMFYLFFVSSNILNISFFENFQ